MENNWTEATNWEKGWWGDCTNTFNEEAKQYIYAHYLGLDKNITNWYGRRGWDLNDASILDIGGGPVSILLKTKARKRSVLDPCDYPAWVAERYKCGGVEYIKDQAENESAYKEIFDEIWIYNCLQHVVDPEKILTNARKYSKIIRIFEWIDTGVSDGHLHNLTTENLDKWLGGFGKVENINRSPVVGKAYFGIFLGANK